MNCKISTSTGARCSENEEKPKLRDATHVACLMWRDQWVAVRFLGVCSFEKKPRVPRPDAHRVQGVLKKNTCENFVARCMWYRVLSTSMIPSAWGSRDFVRLHISELGSFGKWLDQIVFPDLLEGLAGICGGRVLGIVSLALPGDPDSSSTYLSVKVSSQSGSRTMLLSASRSCRRSMFRLHLHRFGLISIRLQVRLSVHKFPICNL